jgi:hypothetical protein
MSLESWKGEFVIFLTAFRLKTYGLKLSVYNIFNTIRFIKSIEFVTYTRIFSWKINRLFVRFGYIAKLELDPFEWVEATKIISVFLMSLSQV